MTPTLTQLESRLAPSAYTSLPDVAAHDGAVPYGEGVYAIGGPSHDPIGSDATSNSGNLSGAVVLGSGLQPAGKLADAAMLQAVDDAQLNPQGPGQGGRSDPNSGQVWNTVTLAVTGGVPAVGVAAGQTIVQYDPVALTLTSLTATGVPGTFTDSYGGSAPTTSTNLTHPGEACVVWFGLMNVQPPQIVVSFTVNQGAAPGDYTVQVIPQSTWGNVNNGGAPVQTLWYALPDVGNPIEVPVVFSVGMVTVL